MSYRHLASVCLILVSATGCGREVAAPQKSRLIIPAAAESIGASAADSSGDGTAKNTGPGRNSESDISLVNGNPGYVGPDSCGECHRERLHEFQSTRHYLASVAPTKAVTAPHFKNSSVEVRTHLPGVIFEVSKSEAEWLQRVHRHPPSENPTAAGEVSDKRRVDFAYGFAGSADEVYFSWIGNRLRELPLGWLHSENCWGVQQFTDPAVSGDFSRVTTPRCLECHNTWFEHRLGTANEYRPSSFLAGVTCERCHGPGQEHVEFHRANPAETEAKAIVHPGHLTRDRKMDVCGQCHSGSVFRRTELFSFRPGDNLDDHFRQHQNPNFEDDHVANQVKYLKQSRCFEQSETLSCVTCHSPHHVSPAQQQGTDSCVRCHQPADCGEQSRLPAGIRQQCADCHMPKYARLAVRFHTAAERYVFPVRPTLHRIAVYPAARDETLLHWHQRQSDSADASEISRLAIQLQEFWSAQAAGYLAEHRLIAAIGALREAIRFAGITSPESAAELTAELDARIGIQTEIDQRFSRAMRLQEEGRFSEAIAELQELLKLKPDHAMAMAKVGTLLALLGREAEAVVELTASLKHDPDSSYGDNMLGWLAYLRKDYPVAVKHFQRAEEIYPFTAENNYRWALTLIGMRDWPEAAERLQTAVRIAPEDPQIHARLSESYRALGRNSESLQSALRAAELTDYRDADMLAELFESQLAGGKTDDAFVTARRALDLPGLSDSALSVDWQRRLDSLPRR